MLFYEYLMIQQINDVEICCGVRLLIQEYGENVEKKFECKNFWVESSLGFWVHVLWGLHLHWLQDDVAVVRPEPRRQRWSTLGGRGDFLLTYTSRCSNEQAFFDFGFTWWIGVWFRMCGHYVACRRRHGSLGRWRTTVHVHGGVRVSVVSKSGSSRVILENIVMFASGSWVCARVLV
jgi:hypothetical protein